jgi:hypothetical protein
MWALLVILIASSMVYSCKTVQMEAPGPGETLADISTRESEEVYEVPRMPMRLKPAMVGQTDRRTVQLPVAGARSAAVVITAFDIDAVEEARMFINGREVELPEAIVADMLDITVTIPISIQLLKKGTNEIKFEFADDLGGNTNGFLIKDLKMILRRRRSWNGLFPKHWLH